MTFPRLLMALSAVALGVMGLGLTFAPGELLASMGGPSGPVVVLALQVTGALCVGFAMLNWMAKGTILGGIYGRPIVVANLAQWAIGALALLKALAAGQLLAGCVVLALFYTLFAIGFAVLFMRHPQPSSIAPSSASARQAL